MWVSFEVGEFRVMKLVIAEGFRAAYLVKMIASELLPSWCMNKQCVLRHLLTAACGIELCL
jgi:hypothetical protein